MSLEKQEMEKALFAQLIISLATSTMHHLGKLVNPATQKAELNLEAAQSTIDIIDMLESRTKGNLDQEEAAFLKSTLATLKINFVETSKTTPQPSVSETAPASDTGKDDDEKRRFHKSYS